MGLGMRSSTTMKLEMGLGTKAYNLERLHVDKAIGWCSGIHVDAVYSMWLSNPSSRFVSRLWWELLPGTYRCVRVTVLPRKPNFWFSSIKRPGPEVYLQRRGGRPCLVTCAY